MEVYLFILLVILLTYILKGRFAVTNSGFFNNRLIRKETKLYLVFIGSLLFVISAFRDISVGIDTISYLWSFERIGYTVPDLSISLHSEYGYTLLEYLCRDTGVGFRGVLVFGAALYIIPVLYVIYKYSENPYLSLFYFVTLDYFCFSMTGMRQCIALGICLIAFEMALRKNIILFLLFVGSAVMFHSTAIVFLPVYFLQYFPIQKKYMFLFALFGLLCFVFRGYLVTILQAMSRNYYDHMNVGGTGMYLYMLLTVVLAFIYGPKRKEKNVVKNLITYMMMVAVLIYPILQFNPTVFRLHYYFSIMIILFIPTVLKNIRNAEVRFFFSYFFFFVAVYYFLEFTMENMGVNPYSFGM